MTGKIRWGVISTANIGKTRVIPAIQASNNGEVVAISSRNFERAQQAADELGIPRAYGSYEELINDPEIDAIYNPLPNSQHAEWSILCAEADKPTLCEKPLAIDADEAQTIVDAFKNRGVKFAEAFMYRFHPQTQRVKEIVASGGVGDLKVMSASFTFPLRAENNIRLSKELVGGSLMDVGCYCINVMRFITGEEPEDVQAFRQMGKASGVDETFAGMLQFPSGVIGHFDSSLRSKNAHTYDLRGTEGRILVPQGFVMPVEETEIHYWHGDQYEVIKIPATNHYQVMAEDFADSILNNREPRFHPQDAVQNMQVIDSLVASAR